MSKRDKGFVSQLDPDFYYYMDRGGKMPFLDKQKKEFKTHPYYIRYVGDRPVAYHGPIEIVATRSPLDNQLKFYDYSKQEFVLAETVKAE
jgi:hypothetical protein